MKRIEVTQDAHTEEPDHEEYGLEALYRSSGKEPDFTSFTVNPLLTSTTPINKDPKSSSKSQHVDSDKAKLDLAYLRAENEKMRSENEKMLAEVGSIRGEKEQMHTDDNCSEKDSTKED